MIDHKFSLFDIIFIYEAKFSNSVTQEYNV